MKMGTPHAKKSSVPIPENSLLPDVLKTTLKQHYGIPKSA